MTIEISGLPDSPGLADSDLLATKKGTQDYKAPLDDLSEFIIDKITPTQVLELIKAVDADTNGVNASTLQGNNALSFRNASNLSSGTVPNSRLPSGSWSGAFNTSQSNYFINLPEFMFGTSLRLRLAWGVSPYTSPNLTRRVDFRAPFVSGMTGQNEPIIITSAQCIFDSTVGGGDNRIEVNARIYDADLNGFSFATERLRGSGSDTCRINYIAIGRY